MLRVCQERNVAAVHGSARDGVSWRTMPLQAHDALLAPMPARPLTFVYPMHAAAGARLTLPSSVIDSFAKFIEEINEKSCKVLTLRGKHNSS